MTKKLNFEEAILIGGGGRIDGPTGAYIVRSWMIKLSTGEKYENDLFTRPSASGEYSRQWRKWCTPGPNTYMQPHWRKAAKSEAEQVESWLISHKDYLPNDVIDATAGK